MMSVKGKEKNVTTIQVKCSKCGHINERQDKTLYLYNKVNTRYCDLCKSMDIDRERVY